MKKIILLMLIWNSWALADNLVATKINSDRSGVEVTYLNHVSTDMFCPKINVKIEYCNSYYCDVVGETLSTKFNIYIEANNEISFPVENATENIRNQYPEAIISRIKDIDTTSCRSANFRDYCEFANKSIYEQNSLDQIINYAREESCEINVEELKFVKINKAGIKSLKPFSYLNKLERLVLADNEIEDLSDLYSLENLWSIVVDNNPIKSLEGVLNKKLMTRVSAKNIPLESALHGPYISSLKYLELGHQGSLCYETKANFESQQSSVKVLCD